MNCETALALLYDLVDGEIGRDDAVSLALHLAACPSCAQSLAQMKSAEGLYAAKTPVEPPPELAGRIAAAVRAEAAPARPSAIRGFSIAAAMAAASAGAALVLERSSPGSLSGLAARIGAASATALASVRLEGAPDAAAAWSRLTAWLATPAALGGSVALLAALVALQVGGSALVLSARGRRNRP
jgi:predicted anti-sigma-YlaC factor YlaD